MTVSYRAGLTQNDLNWLNLSQDQRDYFHHLAAGDSDRNGQEFFEDTVPAELHEHPELVEAYLNGDEELGVSDKDWSHDVSVKNGGSDSADNGRFEDASTNRSRQERNTTAEEQFEADAESEEDVRTLLETVEEGGNVVLAAEALEFAGSALEFGLDCLAPVVGGWYAGKTAANQFESTQDKVGYGSLAAGGAVLYLVSPAGPPTVAAFVGYKAVKRLWKWANK